MYIIVHDSTSIYSGILRYIKFVRIQIRVWACPNYFLLSWNSAPPMDSSALTRNIIQEYTSYQRTSPYILYSRVPYFERKQLTTSEIRPQPLIGTVRASQMQRISEVNCTFPANFMRIEADRESYPSAVSIMRERALTAAGAAWGDRCILGAHCSEQGDVLMPVL